MHEKANKEIDPNELSPELLLWGYQRGWFPMADPDDPAIHWYNPDPRAILPLDDFHIPKNLLRQVNKGRFDITCDKDFAGVMRACSVPRTDDDQTWIDQRMIDAYVELNKRDKAHSIEARLDGKLVGGLYGVQIAGAFFGESMFSLPASGGSNSSKICLVHLVKWMKSRGMSLLDTQFWTEHLDRFGCIEIARDEYLARLSQALSSDIKWGNFTMIT